MDIKIEVEKIIYHQVIREGVKNTQRGGPHKSRDLRQRICDTPKIVNVSLNAYFLFASTEWPFHSGRNEMIHFIPAGMEHFIPAGMEWAISFRPERNGPFHSGRNEMTIPFWFHMFPTDFFLTVLCCRITTSYRIQKKYIKVDIA